MGYVVSGNELETDAEGYLLEPDYSDEVVNVIAAAENIELTPKHWEVSITCAMSTANTATRPIFATC